MRLAKHFISFSRFNKFNNTRAQMLDGIKNTYFWRKNVMILSLCTQRSYGRHNVSRLFVRSFV